MRARNQVAGCTVAVVAGTHTVMLAMDFGDAARPGCLGFAIQRVDHTEDETVWMRGQKTFANAATSVAPGQDVSSREHPFQAFQWFDYTAKPGYRYTYRVIPLYGSPEKLIEGKPVPVEVRTEVESDGRHGIYFNRGACSSQAYARRFQNKEPGKVGEPAYRWLSRGLREGLLAFIERATDGDYAIHGAVYEFQWPEPLNALAAARARGATVRVVVDGIEEGLAEKNRKALTGAGLNESCIFRTRGKIMHNKFLILSHKDKPIAVWTGSTNWTENGIFGHSNCAHVLEHPLIARQYLDYWEVLAADPATDDLRTWLEEQAPAPPKDSLADEVAICSPRKGQSVLDWYAELAGSAEHALFMTFAFGMNRRFLEVYQSDDSVLRYALMEKEGNGKYLEKGKAEIREVRRRRNVIVAVANNLQLNILDRWVAERRSLKSTANIKWIHTKYALVDPLGPNPIVITGSANFSEASTNQNDENMLVIRGDRRVAEIYFTEFMRLHSHYAFREAVAIAQANAEDFEQKRTHLLDNDTWQRSHFQAGTDRWMRRRYFFA